MDAAGISGAEAADYANRLLPKWNIGLHLRVHAVDAGIG